MNNLLLREGLKFMFTHPVREVQLSGSKIRALYSDDEEALRGIPNQPGRRDHRPRRPDSADRERLLLRGAGGGPGRAAPVATPLGRAAPAAPGRRGVHSGGATVLRGPALPLPDAAVDCAAGGRRADGGVRPVGVAKAAVGVAL